MARLQLYIYLSVSRYALVDMPCRQTIIRHNRVELFLTVTGGGGLLGDAIAAPDRNIYGGDYFLLAHQEGLSYMFLFIEDLDKLTNHRFALQRKMPLDGQKGAR